MPTIQHQTEADRISGVNVPSGIPAGMHLFEIEAVCEQDANLVLGRVREVLKILVSQDPNKWPTNDQWRSLLPEWFVQACAEEPTKEETEAWLAEWRKLGPIQQAEAIENVRWSMEQFVYWFQPSERQWWWWAAEIQDIHRLRIILLGEERNPAHEVLNWLLKAAGASRIMGA